MGEGSVKAPLRILNLALNLIDSETGKSLERLLEQVPGYQAYKPDTARRYFERDIDQLRDAGLKVEVLPGDPPRYRIRKSTFAREEVKLTETEAQLLTHAARAWREDDVLQATLLNKLRGYASAPLPEAASPLAFGKNEGGLIEALTLAIENEQPVSFLYSARSHESERSVAPWSIVARGRWFYLWGYDLDRLAPRLFRLSRFRSKPELLGDPGDAAPVGTLSRIPFDESAFIVAPLFLVDPSTAPVCFSASVPLKEDKKEDEDEGAAQTRLPKAEPLENSAGADPLGGPISGTAWQLRRGTPADAATWESSCLREACGVKVLEPEWFAQSVLAKLQAASHWSGGSNG